MAGRVTPASTDPDRTVAEDVEVAVELTTRLLRRG
jgi:hypothetical protein